MKDLNAYWQDSLAGKKVLITGGTTGIGRELAVLLTSFGANCLICGRNQEQIEETIAAAEEDEPSGTCAGVALDLSTEDGISHLFDVLDQELGQLDILVNNAALAFGAVTEGSYQELSYIVQTNLTAYLACSREAIKRMETTGKGHIVNIGSMSADVREQGSSVYVATKGGIQAFSEALRKEVNEKQIKVTLIEPGAVDTDMQDGTAEENAEQIKNQEMLPASDIAMAVSFCLIQHERCDIVELRIRPHLQMI